MPTNHHSCNEHTAINHCSPLTADSPMTRIDRESNKHLDLWGCYQQQAEQPRPRPRSYRSVHPARSRFPGPSVSGDWWWRRGHRGLRPALKGKESNGLKTKGKHFKDSKICAYTCIHTDRHTHTHRGTCIQASDTLQRMTRVTPSLALLKQNFNTYFIPHTEMTSR